MLQLVMPLWLAVIVGVTLVVLLLGTLVIIGTLIRQGMIGQVDFRGSMPINEFSTDPYVETVRSPNPRLEGVHEQTQEELLSDVRQQQIEQSRPGSWRHPGAR